MNNLLENILVGVIVAIITSIATWLYRKKILNRVQGIKQIYGEAISVYKSSREAVKDIKKDCLKSSQIKYVGDYNSTFINSRYPPEMLLYEILEINLLRKQKPCLVQLLHFSPKSKFVDIRARELNYSANEIRNGVLGALRNVKEAIRQLRIPVESVQVRHYDFQVLLRAIILDHCCYIGFYKVGRMGGFSPLLKLKRESEFYSLTERYFNILWEHYSYPGEEDL